MLGKTKTTYLLAASLFALLATTTGLQAQTADGKFYRAYYLDHAKGDLPVAAKLYGEVVADGRTDATLKAEARARLAACREELACSDFARLMPADALFYAEINQPGDQVARLLEQLGLLAGEERPAGEGAQRVAVSPALIKELLGIRGAAVAVTGFDPIKQMPAGVLVFHPGDVEVIRGLIETGLPVGGQPVKPIRGFATYEIEGQVTVTLTSRLVVVSTQRPQIINVLRRLEGEESSSLATNEALAGALKDRDDSLVFFCLNAKPVMPLLNTMLGAAGSQNQELAIAQAVLDLNSIQSLVGHVGISDEGMFFDVALRLDEGHRNLVYNFFRTARINPDTVKSIPEGAAAFLVTALNEASTEYRVGQSAGAQASVVTAMDFGREVFANITGLAVFAVPPTDGTAPTGLPIPDVAAVITVNDPAKSEALWSTALGVGTLAVGATSIEGAQVDIDGVSARSYLFPEGVSVYLAMVDHNVLISPSRPAIAQAVRAMRSGRSVLNDEAFAKSISRVNQNTTLALFAHPRRCAEIAKRFMRPEEIAEMEPFLEPMADTVASVVIDHSNEMFQMSGMISGLPDVGPIISRLIAQEQHHREMNIRLSKAVRHGKWDEAVDLIDTRLAEDPDSVKLLQKKFDMLAGKKRDREAALACGDAIFQRLNDSAGALNNFAWALLTKDRYDGGYAELARRMSLRSNEITKHKNWAYVDTLALAEFENGNIQGAIELERKCLKLCGDASGKAAVERALARFEAAMEKAKVASVVPGQ